ncbi:MAG: histone-like DNA-binding protein [Bacteroidetes bacterium]|nr:histone-like DNA-binding protein [Bacteroidota bacterium]
MSVGYIIQKKMIHVGYNPGEKYVARIFREQVITLKKLAQEIAASSSLSAGTVLDVAQSLFEKIADHASEGQTVKIDALGTFSVAINAKAVDTLEEVTPDTIERVYVRFTPSKDLKTIMENAGVKYKNLDIKGIQFRGDVPPTP